MPVLHLKQPEFTYSAFGPFNKHREGIQKFRGTKHTFKNVKHTYRNELDKDCFAHDAEYSDSKDFAKRTISNQILKDRAHEIARNCRYDGCQKALSSMVYKFFDKKQDQE